MKIQSPWTRSLAAALAGLLLLGAAVGANTPTTYCQSKVNSLGCTPTMTTDPGCPQFNGPAWHVTATDLASHTPGMLLIGHAQQNVPFQGGRLCVGLVLLNPQLMSSGGNPPPADCSGTLSVEITSFIPVQFYGPAYAQAYARDPGDPFGVSLSDAVMFDYGP